MPGGILAVSELTWLTAEPPEDLRDFWNREYSEVGHASAKLAVLEAQGFTPIGYFPLPVSCWVDFHEALQARFPAFLREHGHSAEARAVVEAEERQIALYDRHREHVSYGFYVARKVGG